MRQRGLVDHADRPTVRLQPDRAHRLAVDLHAALITLRRNRNNIDPGIARTRASASLWQSKSGRNPPVPRRNPDQGQPRTMGILSASEIILSGGVFMFANLVWALAPV